MYKVQPVFGKAGKYLGELLNVSARFTCNFHLADFRLKLCFEQVVKVFPCYSGIVNKILNIKLIQCLIAETFLCSRGIRRDNNIEFIA